jgi:hypothetical protein
MPDTTPLHVQSIGMRKVCRIHIRREHFQHNPFTSPDVCAVDFYVLDGSPEENAREAGTTQ